MIVHIIVKNGRYIVAAPYPDSKFIRWSNSRYDAIRFDRREDALKVAQKVGGRVEEFNTITGVIM